MIIVKPSAELLSLTTEPLKLIEVAGRTCYKSEDKITEDSNIKFSNMICNVYKHHSVIEHASATFRFVCDRGVSHELVRHRLASFSQESTRYVNYGSDKQEGQIKVIKPNGLNESQDMAWITAMQNAESMYMAMLEAGAKPQIARSVLPNSTKTEVVMTANLREWIHVFKMRTSEQAHPQIREIMIPALEILKEKVPVIFDEIDPYTGK